MNNRSNSEEANMGEKMVLLGGGGVANEFQIVTFVRRLRRGRRGGTINDAEQVRVRTRDRLTGRLQTFDPYLWSRSLHRIPRGSSLRRLRIGHYIVTGKEIRYATGAGLFGTVYDCPVVLTLPTWAEP